MSENICRFSLIYFANKLLTFQYAEKYFHEWDRNNFFPNSPQTLKNCCGRRKSLVDFSGPLAWAISLLSWIPPKDPAWKKSSWYEIKLIFSLKLTVLANFWTRRLRALPGWLWGRHWYWARLLRTFWWRLDFSEMQYFGRRKQDLQNDNDNPFTESVSLHCSI